MADRNKQKPTISKSVLHEITDSLHNIKGWGSIEIVVQNYKITQVTEKNIVKKENLHLHEE